MYEEEIKTIKNLIGQARIEQAIEKTLELPLEDLETDVITLKEKFATVEKDSRLGIIRPEEETVRRSQVTIGLLNILKLFQESKSTSKEKTNPVKKKVDPQKTILFLSANPKGTHNMRLENELRKVKDCLEAATYRDQFNLESEPAVRILTILKAIQKHKPAIVHFTGHGVGEEGIIVENDKDEIVKFPTEGLNRLFNRFKDVVECVVLNACYSMDQAEVISDHGMYVVGMNKAIGVEAGTDFSVGFYQSLGEGNDYEFAFDMAMISNSPNRKDAQTPELWQNGERIAV